MLPLVIRSGAGIFGSEDVKIRWDKEKKLRFGKLRILRSITNYETPLSSTSDGFKLLIDCSGGGWCYLEEWGPSCFLQSLKRSQGLKRADCTVVAHCTLSSSCASILVLWRLSDASISSNIFDNRYMHTRSGTLCAFYIWRLFPIPAPHYRKTFAFLFRIP